MWDFHLIHNNLIFKCESINLLCSPSNGSFSIHIHLYMSPLSESFCIHIHLYLNRRCCCSMESAAWAPCHDNFWHEELFKILSDFGSDTVVGSRGDPGGSSTLDQDQPHRREKHHTLTQNLKALDVWVLSFIIFQPPLLQTM